MRRLSGASRSSVSGSVPSGAYSPGIIAQGRFVFVSGQGPLRGGVPVLGTLEMEMELAVENVRLVLQEAGAHLSDVVQCRVFLADIGDFDEMNRVYERNFAHPRPARTTVGASLGMGIKVEVDAIAVLRQIRWQRRWKKEE